MSKKKINTGGEAFPRPIGERMTDDGGKAYSTHQDGMTLLDWFAGMALQGLCANPEFSNELKDVFTSPAEFVTMTVYHIARTMLAERKRMMEGSDE